MNDQQVDDKEKIHPEDPTGESSSEGAEPETAEKTAEEAVLEETAVEEPAPKEEEEPIKIQLIRLQADFENFRKRTRREKEEWTQRSVGYVVEDLLPILDTFELGLANASNHEVQDGIIEGFRMVQDQLNNALGKHGLKPFEAEGEAFDPNLHEAVTHMPSADVPADHVMAQTRRGYMLGEKLLRPAQVVVSSGSPESEG